MATLLIMVGGLGHNQFRDDPPPPAEQVVYLDDAGYLLGQLPDIFSVILKARMADPAVRVIVAVHSMGWITGKHAAMAGLVEQLLVADPVGLPFIAHDVWPFVTDTNSPMRQPGRFFKALPTPFITQLDVKSGWAIEEIRCSHNELPHRQEFKAAVLQALGQEVPPVVA